MQKFAHMDPCKRRMTSGLHTVDSSFVGETPSGLSITGPYSKRCC